LFAAPDGKLLIARTPTAAAPQHQYDVVDRNGHLVAILSMKSSEALIGFGAQSVYVLETDDMGIQRIRRHSWP